jgi:arylsulfatase A-like enzyme
VRLAAAVPVLSLVALITACGSEPSTRPSVLLVTLDTTRRDHLGCYGHTGGTSPSIDAVAAESEVYDDAVSTSSWTLPAHASLFTGQVPTRHQARYDEHGPLVLTQAIEGPFERYRVRGLRPDAVTLAQILHDAGWATGGVVAGPWMKRVFGLDRGFAWWDDANIHEVNGRAADQVTDSALGWIAQRGKEPFFLFLNYFDPHSPFDPPADWLRSHTTALLNDLVQLYDLEIRFMDEQLGRLVAGLRARGLWDDMLVVITADHGELLGEHGLWGHGRMLSQEELRVPLLIKFPARDGRRGRRAERAQLTDVLPTVLDVLGLPLPEDVQGGVLPKAAHPVVAELQVPPKIGDRGSFRALFDGSWKYVDTSLGAAMLYDVAADPGEDRDRSRDEAGRALSMRELLDSYLDALRRPVVESPDSVVDPDTVRALEALGYMGEKKEKEGAR